MKRTGLTRKTPLVARSGLPRATSRISPISAARRAQSGQRKATRAEVFARDQRCQAKGVIPGPCYGKLTPHHLRKASAGGDYTTTNLVALCAAHNGWIEDNPAKATNLGFVR